MQEEPSTFETDSALTLRQLALSLCYAVAAVGAITLIVNLWLLPVKLV